MENVPKIYAAMHAIMKSIPFVTKGQKAFKGYPFRGITDALRVAHPKFLDHNVICIPYVRTTTREQHNINNSYGLLTVVEVEYKFYSTLDGSSVTCAVSGEGISWGEDKGTAIAMSNAFKTMMWQTFCIPVDGTELDGENTTQPQDDSKPSAKRTPAKPPKGAKTPPNAQDRPLASDIGIIVNTLAQLPADCKPWLYNKADITPYDKPPAKFTNAEAMTMIELMRKHYADSMGDAAEIQPPEEEDHGDEPDFITVPCPIDGCGAEMTDKRQYGGAVAFKCPNSDYDKEAWNEEKGKKGVEKGCPGTIWQNEVDKHPDQYPE